MWRACRVWASIPARGDLPTRMGPSTAINLGGSKRSVITSPLASEQKTKIPRAGRLWRLNSSNMNARLFSASLAAAGMAAGSYFYAALVPTSQLFGSTLIAGRDQNDIALTFDDGPNDPYTLQLLELLAQHQVRAVFFL